MSDPTGSVPKYASTFGANKRYIVPLARTDPNICAIMYRGTYKEPYT